MKFDYNDIPEKTKLLEIVKYTKIAGIKSKPLNLEDKKLYDTIQKLGWKLVQACVKKGGIGLSAIQLQIPQSVFVAIDFEDPYVWKFKPTFSIYINPVITPVRDSDNTQEIEGCLSVPDNKKYFISRPREIDIDYWYFDDKGKLKRTVDRVVGHPARILQHEYDHAVLGTNIVERGNKPGKKTRKKVRQSILEEEETLDKQPENDTAEVKEEKPINKKKQRGRPKGSKDKKKRKKKI